MGSNEASATSGSRSNRARHREGRRWRALLSAVVAVGAAGLAVLAGPAAVGRAATVEGRVVQWGAGAGEPPAGAQSRVIDVSASFDRYLALRSDGTVVAWDDSGPVEVPANVTDVRAVNVSGGRYYTALTRIDDRNVVHAWAPDLPYVTTGLGDAPLAQIAGSPAAILVGRTTAGAVIVNFGIAVSTLAIPPVRDVAVWGDALLTVGEDGRVTGWTCSRSTLTCSAVAAGDTGAPALLRVPVGLTEVTDVDAQAEHALARRADGTVVAWGSDDSGESTVPAGLTDAVSVHAGRSSSAAVRADGTVVSWGALPAPPPQGLPVLKVALGTARGLALVAAPTRLEGRLRDMGDPTTVEVGGVVDDLWRVRVQDAAGTGIPGVTVTFTVSAADPGGRFGGSDTATVRTDADGWAGAPRLSVGPTAGQFELAATAPTGGTRDPLRITQSFTSVTAAPTPTPTATDPSPTPTDTVTPTPTASPSPGEDVSPTGSVSPTAGPEPASDDSDLPTTGSSIRQLLVVALGLTAGGAALVLVGRRHL